jgi:type III pantothenate kinase
VVSIATSDPNILDIDVGNTRIKWRLRASGAESRGYIDRTTAAADAWPKCRPDRIRVSSVASKAENEALRRSLESQFGRTPEFAKTSTAAAGVTCGYDDPARLGVDRWLAMLAARQIATGPFVVIDLGTAATIDFVSAEGAHEGGYIVPGLRLMTAALLRGTADVRVNFEAEHLDVGPGRNTAAAVRGGVVSMLADFARNSVARFTDDCAESPHVYLCGGDAELIAALIGIPVAINPQLVLDGLGVALP